MPSTPNEAFLIRSRELAAAQRAGLMPPPGGISRETLARALGISAHTAQRLEMAAVLKVREALRSQGVGLREVLALVRGKEI